MSRTARIASGAILAGVLLVVALVAGVIAAVGSASGVGDILLGPTDPIDARAEILDIDDDPFPGMPLFVDISFVDDRDEVVVTYAEWVSTSDPQLGATMDIVYDATDPEFAWDARDPIVGGVGDTGDAAADADSSVIPQVATWTALGSLLAALLVGALTVPWALAKPARGQPSPPAAWYAPPTNYPPPGHPPPGHPPPGYPPPGYPTPGYAPATPPPPPPVWNRPS